MKGEDVSDIVEEYKEEVSKKSMSKKFKRYNQEILDKNSVVKEFKPNLGGEEKYLFETKERFTCEFLLTDKIEKGELVFISNDEAKMNIFSKKITKKGQDYRIKFEANSLLLNESPYFLALFSEEKELIKGLKIEVRDTGRKFGKRVILEDPSSDLDFPRGKYYVFGEFDNFLEDFESGKECATIFRDQLGLEISQLKDRYDKGKIIGD